LSAFYLCVLCGKKGFLFLLFQVRCVVMGEIAKVMIIIGAVLVLAGLVILVFPRLPFVGKLPGDILIKKDKVTFYFPLATSIVISIIISLILYLINKFR
jgi:hypothetical protein